MLCGPSSWSLNHSPPSSPRQRSTYPIIQVPKPLLHQNQNLVACQGMQIYSVIPTHPLIQCPETVHITVLGLYRCEDSNGLPQHIRVPHECQVSPPMSLLTTP